MAFTQDNIYQENVRTHTASGHEFTANSTSPLTHSDFVLLAKPINANQRVAVAATRLGIDTEEVEQLPFDLSVLEDEGIFVNVTPYMLRHTLATLLLPNRADI